MNGANISSILVLGPPLAAVGGVSTHLNQILSSNLSREFHFVHFQIGSEGRKENFVGKLFRFVWSPFSLMGKLATLKPVIVHLNTSLVPKSFWRDAVYLVITKLCGKKIVYQVHGGKLPEVFFGNSKLLTLFLKWLLSLPDAIVVLAEVERDAYRSFTRYKRLSVIPNAVDLGPYTAWKGKSFKRDFLRLVYIGRLVNTKGIFEVIEAVHILKQQGIKGLKLTIAGSGPADLALKKQVQSLELGDRVKFIGPIFNDKKVHFWREADIFVFPTFHPEGLPYTVLESLASGTPIITTRMGGIPDVISDGVHGVFVKPHDPTEVANAIRTMLADCNRLREMSAACVRRAREYYGIDRLSGQFLSLYTEILE
ncbi:MAG: glycosyltransferase family 4 protein [Balneolaceae bacterium]|nr:glycosyltransferase family 4 protein [Balneolaceae bacterium]